MFNKKWSLLLAVVTIASLLAACTPAETKVETVVVTQIVKETVTVEIAGTTQTIEVTKEVPVEVTRVIEVEKKPAFDDRVTYDFNLGTEPPTADPALTTDTTSVEVTGNIFVGLTLIEPINNDVVPYLATDWDISEDGTVYTFHLRDDIQWVWWNPITGDVEAQRPVTAHDVVYGVKRTLDPATASDYSYVLYIIKNGMAFNTGEEGVTADDVGVVALDDYTVEFTLEYAGAYFPSIASMWVCFPVPQEVIEEFAEKWTEPGLIWTNGPYVMTEWVHGGNMRLEKNPLWVDADSVQIEVVNGYMIQEASTAYAMYLNNEVDTVGVPLPEIDGVKADPVLSKEYYQAPVACTYYYGFVNTKPPFDDVRVRTAFSAAIDRQTLIDQVTKGGQIPATTFAPPGIFGAPEPGTLGLGYDPDLAVASLAEFMAEKGLADTAAFTATYDPVLGHNTSEGHARIAAAIQAMWAEHLNLSARVENQEWKVYLDTIRKDTPVEEAFHVYRLGWCADYADQNNWVFENFHYNEGSNDTRRQCADPNCGSFIGPAEFDTLVKEAQTVTDSDERSEMYARAEDILAREEAAIANIYHYTTVAVTKPWLQRYYPSVGPPYWAGWTLDWEAKKAATGIGQ
jgi:oligopeptide transport system substrate-binding protein